MKLHGNAMLSVKGRELLVDRIKGAGWSLTDAAEAAGVSDRTARKCWPGTELKANSGRWIVPPRRRRSPTEVVPRPVEL